MKSSELGKEVIKKELPLIPKSPGVYRMLNHKDDILYVGKAKNLPNRLKSYVSEKNHIIRTERMLSQTFKIEITTTANESEALLLEANLIKKLTKNKHYNFLETLAEDVFDVLFKDKRIGKIMLQIEKLEILKECTSVGIQITKKRSHEKL